MIKTYEEYRKIKEQADKITKLVCRKSELDDWYVIERDLPEELQAVVFVNTDQGYSTLLYSQNISTSQVEGSRAEMLELAHGILERKSTISGSRCGVTCRHNDTHVSFFSPRNYSSELMYEFGIHDVFPVEDADNLANQIIADLEDSE